MTHNQLPPRPSAETRDELTRELVQRWLGAHPGVDVSTNDLWKTLKQATTETFGMGRERCRAPLPEHALMLLGRVRGSRADLDVARSFAASDALPEPQRVLVDALNGELIDLAAAIQLVRGEVVDAAAELASAQGLLASAETTGLLTREALRGFVVGKLRPRALRLHAGLGDRHGYAVYVEALRGAVALTAEEVLAEAVAKRTKVVTTDPAAMERLEAFVAANQSALQRAARRSSPDAPEDALGDAYVKLAAFVQAHPERELSVGYVQTIVHNAVNTSRKADARRKGSEELAARALRSASYVDEELLEVGQLITERVRAVVSALEAAAVESPDHALARDALVRCFALADDAKASDAATIAARLLPMVVLDPDAVDVVVGRAASALAPTRTAARRATRLALAALRPGDAA